MWTSSKSASRPPPPPPSPATAPPPSLSATPPLSPAAPFPSAATAVTAPHLEPLTLSLDGEPERTRPLAGVLVDNTRHVGGFVALPGASCSDGLADCLELSAGYLSQMAHNLSSMCGANLWMPARVTRFRTAAIAPLTPRELMLDGELFPAVARVEIRVVPAALRCSCLLTGRRRIQTPAYSHRKMSLKNRS